MTERIRDAERSRQAILDAAERLFAERGYDGASLNDIGAAAGLSRGSPGYLFGSKAELYRAVLARVFADRQAATWAALEPVRAWDGSGDLEAAIREAAEAYMEFLASRPSFARFITWEELAGGERLASVPRTSDAMERTFAGLLSVVVARGGADFSVPDAVLLFVSLTYAPLAHRHTLMRAVGRDLGDPAARRAHAAFVARQMVALVGGGEG